MTSRVHVTELLRVEIVRHRRVALRLLASTLVCGVVFQLAGKPTAQTWLAIAFGMGLGGALLVPMGIARDRLDGNLEFLLSLPIDPKSLVVARGLASMLFALPPALVAAVASAFALTATSGVPTGLGFSAWTVVPGVLIACWVALSVLGVLLVAVFCRWDLRDLIGVPMVFVALLILVVPRALSAWVPRIPVPTVIRWLSEPWFAPVFGLSLLVVVGGLCAAAFVLAEHGLRVYRFDPAGF